MTNLFVVRELDESATISLPLPLARIDSRWTFWGEAWPVAFGRVRKLRAVEFSCCILSIEDSSSSFSLAALTRVLDLNVLSVVMGVVADEDAVGR